MSTHVRDKRWQARFSAALDAVLLGAQVCTADQESAAAVEAARREEQSAIADALAALARDVALTQAEMDADAGKALTSRLRGLIQARDRQIADMERKVLRPRLEQVQAALSANDLEELRYQFGQLDEAIGGNIRSLGREWP